MRSFLLPFSCKWNWILWFEVVFARISDDKYSMTKIVLTTVLKQIYQHGTRDLPCDSTFPIRTYKDRKARIELQVNMIGDTQSRGNHFKYIIGPPRVWSIITVLIGWVIGLILLNLTEYSLCENGRLEMIGSCFCNQSNRRLFASKAFTTLFSRKLPAILGAHASRPVVKKCFQSYS